MIGLGILALVYGDFRNGVAPVAPWVPGRTALAYVSGVIMLLGGIGLLFTATVTLSTRILFPYLILWALLKVPALIVAPQIEGVCWVSASLQCFSPEDGFLFAKIAGYEKVRS